MHFLARGAPGEAAARGGGGARQLGQGVLVHQSGCVRLDTINQGVRRPQRVQHSTKNTLFRNRYGREEHFRAKVSVSRRAALTVFPVAVAPWTNTAGTVAAPAGVKRPVSSSTSFARPGNRADTAAAHSIIRTDGVDRQGQKCAWRLPSASFAASWQA